MKCQIRHLIRYAKANDCTISVHDGEEWAVKRSTNEHEIMEAVESVEEASFRIRNAEGEQVAWALVLPDLEPDERIADYSSKDGQWMDAWDRNYAADCNPTPATAKPTNGPGM